METVKERIVKLERDIKMFAERNKPKLESEPKLENKEETLSLEERLEMASSLVRQYTYSITTTKGKKQTKENVLELRNEKLEELMKLLDG